MKFEGKSKRMRERLELRIPVRVYCRESLEHEWVEMSRLLDVTPFGASFIIKHPTERGRLLYLTMPLPRQLRCFDHVEDQYRVWSLVRRLNPLPADAAESSLRYEVGVAFIGKRPPASAETDPSKRYEVAASPTEAGLWLLREGAQPESETTHSPENDRRPDTRYEMAFDVSLEVFDEKGEVAVSERTVTENISPRGAAVYTTLNVSNGRFVRLTSSQYQTSVIAVVRARTTSANGIPRLHLEFVDQQWPLGGIE